MKRNPILEKLRKLRSKYIEIYVDNSFDLSKRIKDLMDVKGMDQKSLANRLNKNESEISKWLSGSHNFTLKTLAKIEEVLEGKLFEVCGKENQKVRNEVIIMINESLHYEENDSKKFESSSLKAYKKRPLQYKQFNRC